MYACTYQEIMPAFECVCKHTYKHTHTCMHELLIVFVVKTREMKVGSHCFKARTCF